MILTFGVFLFVCLLICVTGADPSVVVDASSPPLGQLKHFWDSTGLCPPEPHSEAYKFLLSADEVGNLALIAALPRAAIRQVRIHWLLDLVTVSRLETNGSPRFNFTHLDRLLDILHGHGLTPGFELMGNPSDFFTNFQDDEQVSNWRRLVRETVSRYVDRYGDEYVSTWRFETWNEPDLTSYNIFNFTLPSFLRYFYACSEGLDVGRRLKRLGGPAGLFNSHDRHPLCWGLLEHCANAPHLPGGRCPLDFISFHKKGGGTASAIVQEGRELARDLAKRFPTLAKIPLANDEADPLAGWSKSKPWRADVTYGAMVCRTIADHQSEFARRGLPLEVLSNDNAFLNYHPYYFTQRTLLARFQMNNTSPPHVQFFRKPVYSAMALLAYLGTKEMHVAVNNADERLTVMAAFNGDMHRGDWDAAVLLTYCNDTEVDNQIKTNVEIVVNNLHASDACCKFTVYRLNNARTNPSSVWHSTGAAAFPDRDARRRMRDAEGPERVLNIHQVPPSAVHTLRVAVELALPSVAVLHVCRRPQRPPGPITQLKAFNVTLNEVLLVWGDDHVITPCIKTYEIEFLTKYRRGNDVESRKFRRVNLADSIYLSYQHVATPTPEMTPTTYKEDAAAGVYRVRAVDYWDRPGEYSSITYP